MFNEFQGFIKVFIKFRPQLNLKYPIDQKLNKTKSLRTSQIDLKPLKSRQKRTATGQKPP